VNVYLRLQLTSLLLSAICCCMLCLFSVLLDACPFCFLQYTALPAFCNCSLFFYLEFTWGGAPSPHSSAACHTLATVGCLLLSKHTGGGGTTPAFSGWLIYLQFHEGVPLPYSPELRAPHPLCYMSFFSCLFIIQFVFFSFFSWVGVSLSRGLC
jgi:hypothetical protein